MSKVDRALHGPGWGEVILGAALALVLGVALGAAVLVMRPVVVAKELPKDHVPGVVYYLEGEYGNPATARSALAKRKAFVEGQSVDVTEAEVNALAAAANTPTTPKPGQADAASTLSTGTPNVRIRDGVVQIGVPVKLNVFGVEEKVFAQARGGFAKEGDVFVFEPSEILLGSCPVQRLPFVADYIRSKLLASQKVPDDITAAWHKLANVSVDGKTLKLAMQ